MQELEDGSADIQLEDSYQFVHGGDVCDKGGEVGGTIRVTLSLLRLKEKYPERVFLLLGNRDVNKVGRSAVEWLLVLPSLLVTHSNPTQSPTTTVATAKSWSARSPFPACAHAIIADEADC